VGRLGLPPELKALPPLCLSSRHWACRFRRLESTSSRFIFTGWGSRTRASRIYEAVLARNLGFLLRPSAPHGKEGDGTHPPFSLQVRHGIAPLGFADDQALLPRNASVFQGYRLLREYFGFPQRFMFFELRGLQAGLRNCPGSEVILSCLFRSGTNPSSAGSMRRTFASFALQRSISFDGNRPCAVDRLGAGVPGHSRPHSPDGSRGVSSLEASPATDSALTKGASFNRSFTRHTATARAALFFSVRREMAKGLGEGAVNDAGYAGSDVYISLVDTKSPPWPPISGSWV